jgi:hypothetical protein
MSLFNVDNLNDLISNTNNIISCGPDCVKENTAAELKQKYEQAQYNQVNAEYNVSNSAKNYITYTEGESGYNEYLDEELGKKANKTANDYNKNFNNNAIIIENNINTFKSLFLNESNIRDLYVKYKNENDTLEQKLKNTSADIITNDRKSYYEEEGVSKLNNYYYFFIVIYILVLIVFLLATIFVNTTVSLFNRIIILILLIIYPFIIMFLFDFIKKIGSRIKNYIPSYAYRNI